MTPGVLRSTPRSGVIEVKKPWRFVVRDAVSWAIVGLVMAVLLGFAWVSRNPDAAWVRRAAEWPLAGPWVAAFRQRWSPSHGVASVDHEPGDDSVTLVWIEADEADEPGEGSEPLDLKAAFEPVDLTLDTSGPPPLGAEPWPNLPVEPHPADAGQLERARKILGEGRIESALGPYRLLAASRATTALVGLEEVLNRLDESYTKRYGQRPIGVPAETLVLFESGASYVEFRDDWPELRGHPATGHASKGLVATFTEGRDPREVRSTLIHEVTHLLSRRALGPALPAWLDEGIAGDLGLSRFEDGLLVQGSLEEIRKNFEGGWELRGGYASLSLLIEKDSGRHGLEDLLGFDVLRSRELGQFYGESLLLVRCLLADECGKGSRSAFLAYLAAIAQGGGAEPEALRSRLDRPWVEVDRDLAEFIRSQAGVFGLLSGRG